MLDKFPGLLNYGNIIAIHANWPAYPNGIGWELALLTLGNYAPGTYFYQVSEIDRCILLLSQDPLELNNPFDDKYLHVAVWHQDLKELSENGWVQGVAVVNEYEYDSFRFMVHRERMISKWPQEFRDQFPEDEEGNILASGMINGRSFEYKITKPRLEQYDEEELEYKDFVIISEKFTISEAGWDVIKKLSQHVDWHPDIKQLVDSLVSICRFDTAVREASLLIETSIKQFHHIDLFGVRLIDFHLDDLIARNNNSYSAALKCYRGELRTLFKFIRNDFAHNFHVLSEEQCRMILFRISKLYEEFLEVKRMYYGEHSSDR